RAADDPERAEYLVRVKWLKTVPLDKAIKERGFFGNQNTVARPRAPKWQHTVDRLRQRLGITD
ncbi:MAG: nuclease, partial [Nevskiales bacterium]